MWLYKRQRSSRQAVSGEEGFRFQRLYGEARIEGRKVFQLEVEAVRPRRDVKSRLIAQRQTNEEGRRRRGAVAWRRGDQVRGGRRGGGRIIPTETGGLDVDRRPSTVDRRPSTVDRRPSTVDGEGSDERDTASLATRHRSIRTVTVESIARQ